MTASTCPVLTCSPSFTHRRVIRPDTWGALCPHPAAHGWRRNNFLEIQTAREETTITTGNAASFPVPSVLVCRLSIMQPAGLFTVMPAIHVLLFIICSYCFSIPYSIPHKCRCPHTVVFHRDGTNDMNSFASFISHSETFAQSFRPGLSSSTKP